MTKLILNNMYTQTQSCRKYYQENPNQRKLIDNLPPTKPKKEKHTVTTTKNN